MDALGVVGYDAARIEQRLVVKLYRVHYESQNALAFWHNLLENGFPTR